MNEKNLKKIIKRWLYVIVLSVVFVIVGHHAMTYIVAALTAVKSLCDWGMEVLLDSAIGFLVYGIAVLAILIYIEKRKTQEAPEERERGERIRVDVSKDAASRTSRKSRSSIRRIFSETVNGFRNKEADSEEEEKSRESEPAPSEGPESEGHDEERSSEAAPVSVEKADDEAEAEKDLF